MWKRLALLQVLLAATKVVEASPGKVRGSSSGEAQNATREARRLQSARGPDAWMAEFCGRKCLEAGYCCNDYTVGSNQMVSCAQACMMRARGSTWAEMATTSNGLCNRHGGSGCNLTVNGHRYRFCSVCGDLSGTQKCHYGVANSSACDFGASLAPTPEEYCGLQCKAAGFCCNNVTAGSEKVISCTQACVMRALGTPWQDMASAYDGLCKHNGRGSCSLEVNGQRYDLCSTCNDITSTSQCRWGVACEYGALVPASSWGFRKLR